ncbi:MAG: polysaccharide deacetylase family protein [Candidatus Woesearchaeota archaeon]
MVKLLPLLKKLDIRATFFVTGYFAKIESDIIRRIDKEGHEIASSTFFNRSYKKESSKELHNDILKSKDLLETITLSKMKGFRMPLFQENKFIKGIISELGMKYDSSSHPAMIFGYSYNFLKKTNIHYIESLNLIESPVSVFPVVRFPISSAYMRNFGNFYTLLGIELNLLFKDDIVMYFYPWEFIDLHKMKGNPFYTRKTGIKFRKQFVDFVKYMKRNKSDFEVMKNIRV